MNELPDKVVSIDMLRINRNLDKKCKCENKSFVIDSQNRAIYCGSCGSQVDPYESMYYLAANYERLKEQTDRLLEQRKQIADYKPHMIVFRNLEKSYRGKKMLPACPHCDRGFYFEEISCWLNADLEKKWRQREKQ